MPKINATLPNLDNVEEALKPFYVQHDGAFHLDLDETIRDHVEVQSLKNAYERQKTDNATLRQERDAARADLTNATKGKPDEAALAEERKRYEKQIADLTAERDEARGKVTGLTRDTALKAALADAGITNPAFLKAATMMHRDAIKMEGENAVVDGPMGPKPLADFIRNWAAGDEGKAFVTPPSGGGAKGSEAGGDKPLAQMGDAERLELARQGKLRTQT